jgi:hypothetical protein
MGVLLDLAPLPSLTRWRGCSTVGLLTRSPSGTFGNFVVCRASVVAAGDYATKSPTPTVIALLITVGLFRFPFVDQDGRKSSWGSHDCPLTTRTLKVPAMSTTPGTALVLVVVLRLQTTLFHRISHLTNCKDRKEGHPPLLVRAQGLIKWLPRVREPLNVG